MRYAAPPPYSYPPGPPRYRRERGRRGLEERVHLREGGRFLLGCHLRRLRAFLVLPEVEFGDKARRATE